MTDQDKKPEPWGESFKDDQPDQYSRTEHRKKTQRVSWTIGVLVLVVVALSFVPVYGYLQTLNKPNTSEQKWSSSSSNKTKVTDSAKSESEAKKRSSESKAKSEASAKEKSEKAASEKAASEKAASEKAASNQKAQEDADKKAQEEAAKKEQDAAAKRESEAQAASESQANEKQYATVAQGQGAYRVAANAGISQAKLQELNPGVDLGSVSAGQRLRVQ